MENIKEMIRKIDREYGKLVDKEMQPSEWDTVFKSADALYHLYVVCAMEKSEKNGEQMDPAMLSSMMADNGVSMRGDYRGTGRAYYPVDMSFGRMPSGNNAGNYDSGNSYHGSTSFNEQLRQMMNNSNNMEQREAARMLLQSMQNSRNI